MATATSLPNFLHGKNTRVLYVNPWFTSATFTANTTNGSYVIVATTTIGPISVGQSITGSGIPASTVVVAIQGNTITLSAAATATASGATMTVSSTGIGYDFSPYFNDVSVSTSQAAEETTTFLQGGSKTFIPGLKDGTITLSGFHDGTIDGTGSIFHGANATPYDKSILVFPAGGLLDSERCFMANAVQTKFDIKSPVAGVVTNDMEVQADGGVWRGHGQYLVVSTSGNSNAYTPFPAAASGTADTSKGGLLVLGIQLLTGGGTIAVNFQHSSDSSTWSTLATISSAGATVTTLTGTIHQYTRLQWVFTGGTTPSANIYYGFARY